MKRYKYPRTSHFVWSKGATSDDKILHDLSNFEGKNVDPFSDQNNDLIFKMVK